MLTLQLKSNNSIHVSRTQRSAVSHSVMAPKSLRPLNLASRRNTSSGPPSPTFSEATNVSTMHFGANRPSKVITRANLKASLQAYEDVSQHLTPCYNISSHSLPVFLLQLLTTCGAYRATLIAMSKATAAFADAMQRCSGSVPSVFRCHPVSHFSVSGQIEGSKL